MPMPKCVSVMRKRTTHLTMRRFHDSRHFQNETERNLLHVATMRIAFLAPGAELVITFHWLLAHLHFLWGTDLLVHNIADFFVFADRLVHVFALPHRYVLAYSSTDRLADMLLLAFLLLITHLHRTTAAGFRCGINIGSREWTPGQCMATRFCLVISGVGRAACYG